MKNKGHCLEWKLSGMRIFVSVVVMLGALLVVCLCACRSQKESSVEYELTTSENYRERRLEEHEKRIGVRTEESMDTVKVNSALSGEIRLDRDTAGRVSRIIYDRFFSGLLSQGSSRVDTIREIQKVVVRDSVASGQTDVAATGHNIEKKDAGISKAELLWVGILLICPLLILLPLLIYKIMSVYAKK